MLSVCYITLCNISFLWYAHVNNSSQLTEARSRTKSALRVLAINWQVFDVTQSCISVNRQTRSVCHHGVESISTAHSLYSVWTYILTLPIRVLTCFCFLSLPNRLPNIFIPVCRRPIASPAPPPIAGATPILLSRKVSSSPCRPVVTIMENNLEKTA